jgi:Fe(3+) dicitrate transport protein
MRIIFCQLAFREPLSSASALSSARLAALPMIMVSSLSSGMHGAAYAQTTPIADDAPKTEAPAKPAKDKSLPQQTVEGKRPWDFNKKTRYAHSLPEVNGPTITVTKKTSVVDLDAQPAVIDNNQREVFDRLPGVVLAEQQNPTELNLSYRGLGNPQESEYILVMQDGLPIELDWIGYPTLYYLPVPQTIQSLQMIRAGSGLLYGPEPQPVLNFVSRAPNPDREFAGTTEQVGGSHDLFSSFNQVSGTVGNFEYLADYSHRQSDGERVNGQYRLNSGDMHLGMKLDDAQSIKFDFHAYSLISGLAGLMSFSQYEVNRNQTTTPDDNLETQRYSGVITYEIALTDHLKFTQKAWAGYDELLTRSDAYSAADPGEGVGATLSDQRFHFTGLDGRSVWRWGMGNALTVGYTAYYSESPYDEYQSTNPLATNTDESGTPFYRDDRRTRYGALFAENVFRLPYFHVVTSARIDHEQLDTHETLAPHPLLVDASYSRNIPLFGVGIGNDFGHGNETYFNVSQGFRPMRYLDIASPFSNFSPGNNPEPTKYLTYELGVHGWPRTGLYYDVSLFQVNVRNRIESEAITQTETIDVNTGDTRSRGVEAEGSFDFLSLAPNLAGEHHLDVFANASLLDAHFTSSIIPGQAGKIPAYAPHYVVKSGVTWRRDQGFHVSLIANLVGSQYFQDSDEALAGTPAKIPTYTVVDLNSDYTLFGHLRLLGGISNLTNRHYYSRVFLVGGSLEPANTLAVHAGAAYDF